MQEPNRTAKNEAHHHPARQRVETVGLVLGTVAVLLFLWYVGDAFLIIFAGVLLASGLDAAIGGLGKLAPLRRAWRFAVVLVLFAVALGGFLAFGGALAAQQIAEMLATIQEELQRSRSILAESDLARYLGDSGDALLPMLPNPAGMLSGASTAVTGIFGVIGSGILIVMLGIFLSYQPRTYRDGLVRLLPPDKRQRMRAVLDEAGSTLRWWIVGIVINMVVIAAFTTLGLLLIGVPHAVGLGVQAGLLAFVPTVGPLLAAIPIILVSLGQGLTTVLWALALYAAVQTLESNVLTPLVQSEMVSLYPGTILIVQLIMLALFGPAGLALATPLAAVGKTMVQRLYVEDVLGDKAPHGASG